MEKPKIKQVHLVAEMENGDIKQLTNHQLQFTIHNLPYAINIAQ